MKKIVGFSIAFVFILALGVHAQFGGRGTPAPQFHGQFKPVAGSWAEYQVKMRNQGETPGKMKISIVGKEGEAYWYEMVMQGKERMISKILVSGDPEDRKNVKRMIMKVGNEPAMEMPVMGQPKPPQGKSPSPKGKLVDKGMESVTVPAGTFQARHMQYQGPDGTVDSWVSEKVPPYGVVKSQAKDFEMILTGYGMNAKSLVTETPKKMQMPTMPGMPEGMMPPGMKQ
jgi:hypothetical protein